MARTALALLAAVAALSACSQPVGTAQPANPPRMAATSPSSPTSSPFIAPSAPTSTPVPRPSVTKPTPAPQPTAEPFDADTVLGGIRALAKIGPRDAVSRSYDTAAAYVAGRLRDAGYRVTLQEFRVPAGVSWGVKVPSGTSVNVIADPPGFDAHQPHVVVGAHLDTVPQAPGAEDNASGVMVMAEVARMLGQQPGALPVRFVAFGAEESRGGTGNYAFGSRHYVSALDEAGRRAVRGMVALDRVGVSASHVPVCDGGRGTPALAKDIRTAAAPLKTKSCLNRASDHVSFEAVGIPAARIGSVPYAAYHSARDVPSVVDREQLAHTGAVLWAWLRSARP